MDERSDRRKNGRTNGRAIYSLIMAAKSLNCLVFSAQVSWQLCLLQLSFKNCLGKGIKSRTFHGTQICAFSLKPFLWHKRNNTLTNTYQNYITLGFTKLQCTKGPYVIMSLSTRVFFFFFFHIICVMIKTLTSVRNRFIGLNNILLREYAYKTIQLRHQSNRFWWEAKSIW